MPPPLQLSYLWTVTQSAKGSVKLMKKVLPHEDAQTLASLATLFHWSSKKVVMEVTRNMSLPEIMDVYEKCTGNCLNSVRKNN